MSPDRHPPRQPRPPAPRRWPSRLATTLAIGGALMSLGWCPPSGAAGGGQALDWGERPTRPAAAALGPGLAIDAKDNRTIGGPQRTAAALRFESDGGRVVSVAFVQRFGAGGYSAGTGGRIRVSLQAEAGGRPSGRELGAAEFDPGNTAADAERYDAIPLTTLLPAGRAFLVIENVDPHPEVNYISANQVTVLEPPDPHGLRGGALAVFQRTPESDWAEYRNSSGDGVPAGTAYRNTPVLDVAFADGRHAGQGYASVILNWAARVSGTAMARERFTVSGSDRLVSQAAVRLKRLGGDGAVTIRLLAGTTVLAEAKVSADVAPLTRAPRSLGRHWDEASIAGGRWAVVSFPRVTLRSGQEYVLEVSTDTATTYLAIPIREVAPTDPGGPVGWPVFSDGVAERTSDGRRWRPLAAEFPVDLAFWLR